MKNGVDFFQKFRAQKIFIFGRLYFSGKCSYSDLKKQSKA